jgi:type II secretory pathway component PulF
MAQTMQACPHCGSPNSIKRAQCFQCGKALAEVPAPAAEAAPVPAPAPAPAMAPPAVEPTPPTPRPLVPSRRDSWINTALVGATLPHRAQMYRQLQNLLRSGIPIVMSLNYLQENVSGPLRAVLRTLQERTQRGEALSACMDDYPNFFPEWEVQLIRAAEAAGTLPEAAGEMANTLELELTLRRRVASGTFYIKAVAVVFVIVFLIVRGVRGGMSVTDAFTLVTNSSALVFIGIMLLLLLRYFWSVFTRTRRGAAVSYFLTVRTPIVGPLMRNAMRIRFARVLAALWRAGVAPVVALETAAKASGNPFLSHKVQDLLALLGRGSTLSEVIAAMGVFPNEAMYLIRSGETSGNVAESLDKVAEYLQVEVDGQVATLPQKIQLLFYAIVVPFVAWFIISFYGGYFSALLSTQ